jgi:4-hydroxy-3-polyprenylbenzoate decarboxylase
MIDNCSSARRIIIGMSGASGAVLGLRLLQVLKPLPVETHLVLTRAAEITLGHETDVSVAELRALVDHHHAINNIAASISSGSFTCDGMIVAPCSVRSLSEIAYGTTSNLLTRAADVTLKERRRLVLLVRETPLHSGHLRAMLALSDMGAVIAPPVPAFYAKPESVMDLVDHTVARSLDLFGMEAGRIRRWEGLPASRESPDGGASG